MQCIKAEFSYYSSTKKHPFFTKSLKQFRIKLMMHKFIPNYLLTLLIFSTITGILISFPGLSASIIISKDKTPLHHQQEQKSSTKYQRDSKQHTDIKMSYKPSNFIKPIDPPPPKQKLFQNQKHKNQSSNKKPLGFVQYNLLKQGKQFFFKNKHNTSIQEYLILFDNTKQVIQETDLILQDLSQQILLSLQLEQLLVNNQLSILQKNNNAQSKTQQPYEDISKNFDILTKSSKLYINPTEEYALTLLYKILQIKNLLYLMAVIVFYSIIKESIKLILLRKQRKQKYRYR